MFSDDEKCVDCDEASDELVDGKCADCAADSEKEPPPFGTDEETE